MSATAIFLDVEERRHKSLQKLIDVSHESPMNYADSLDWERGVDRTLPPKIPAHSWIAGTACEAALTAEQRQEVLWLEIARDVSMFMSLEQTLPVLYVGYLNKYERDLSPEIYQYLMIFSKEEIVHTMVFKRYMQVAGLPQFGPEGSARFLLDELPKMHPAAGILFTLILEWVAELGAMYSTQAEGTDPLTRELFHRHHVDESRHIAFGRWIAESHFANAPTASVEQLRQITRKQIERLIPAYTFNPGIAKFTSFKFPVAPDDEAQIAEIHNSAANRAINEKRFAPLYTWLNKMGIL